jgi:hypothetical protein
MDASKSCVGKRFRHQTRFHDFWKDGDLDREHVEEASVKSALSAR